MLIITNEETADVKAIRVNIPEALAAVIDKGLLKHAELRYQSDTEFADALKVFPKA